MKTPTRLNCIKCKYYQVTWDPKNPRGCSRFGFKSSKMPYLVVFQSSGRDCISFEEKR